MKPRINIVSIIQFGLTLFLFFHFLLIIGFTAGFIIINTWEPKSIENQPEHFHYFEIKVLQYHYTGPQELKMSDTTLYLKEHDTVFTTLLKTPKLDSPKRGYSMPTLGLFMLNAQLKKPLNQIIAYKRQNINDYHWLSPSFYMDMTLSFKLNDPFWIKILPLIIVHIVIIYSFIIFFLIYQFFSEINQNTPFSHKNARRLFIVGLMIMLAPVLKITGYHYYSEWYLKNISIFPLELAQDYNFDFWMFFTGILILIIGETFHIGVNMQEERKLTI